MSTHCFHFRRGEEFEEDIDPWTAPYFTRTMNNDNMWMFFAPYSDGKRAVFHCSVR